MRQRTPISRAVLAGGGLAALALFGSATAALADPAPAPAQTVARTPAETPAQDDAGSPGAPDRSKALQRRADRLCAKAPRVEERLTRVIARISGDATTRGSVQWLRAKADRVRATDPTLAALLDSRAQIRQARLPVLQLRKQELPKVTAWCAAHGHPAGK